MLTNSSAGSLRRQPPAVDLKKYVGCTAEILVPTKTISQYHITIDIHSPRFHWSIGSTQAFAAMFLAPGPAPAAGLAPWLAAKGAPLASWLDPISLRWRFTRHLQWIPFTFAVCVRIDIRYIRL